MALLSLIVITGLSETLLLFELNPLFLLPLALIPLLKPRPFALVSLFIVIGIARSLGAVHTPTENDVDFYAQPPQKIVETEEEEQQETTKAEKVSLIGVVCVPPDVRITSVRLTVCAENLGEKAVQGKVLLKTTHFPAIHYGDRIKAYGSLEIPFETADFSYKNYLAKDGIYATMPWAQVDLLATGGGNPVLRFLLVVRGRFEENLKSIIPQPESGFAAGILLGARGQMSDRLELYFQRAGLSHLLALSGFNITILIVALFWLFRPLPKRIALLITFLAVISFVLMVGAGASIVRAAIMGLIGLLALHSGRGTKPLHLLALASALMVLWNPKIILYDVSFQLSVAGVFGIVVFVPFLQKTTFFQKIPQTFGFREAILVTLSAQIAVAPLSAFHFQTFSLVAPLANPLLAPLVPLAMLLAFLTAILAFFSHFLALIVGYLAYLILHLGLFIAEFFGNLSWAEVAVESALIVAILWLFLTGLIFLAWRKRKSAPIDEAVK